MKIEDQVITPEQAERLRELGVSQNSYWCWAHEVKKLHESFNGEVREMEPEFKDEPTIHETSFAQWEGLPYASAYTLSEIFEMIGMGTVAAENHWRWLTEKVNSGFSGTICYSVIALADWLITEIQESSLTPEEINQRL